MFRLEKQLLCRDGAGSGPQLLRRHPYFSAVNDLDETKGLVARLYCGHDMSLTEHGHLNAWMNAVRVGSNEVVVAPGVGVVVSATVPMQVELSGDSALLIICVGRNELERCAADMLGAPITAPLTFEPRMDLADGRIARWCRQVLVDLEDLDGADSLILGHGEAARAAERKLITSLLLIQRNNYSEKLAMIDSRTGAGRIVRIVDEYIDAHAGVPLRVEDLAAQANCSVRALQTAFMATTEQSPMHHLREKRLCLAREKLTVAPPGSTTVTAIAASCGLTHHGRFTEAYRNRYGEVPSVTLRRG